MALICDTSGVYALYDTDDAQHEATIGLVKAEPGPLLLPVILLAEIDYLLNRRLGHEAAFEFIEAVEQGDFTLVALSNDDFIRCREVVAQYRALKIGLADTDRGFGPSFDREAGAACSGWKGPRSQAGTTAPLGAR